MFSQEVKNYKENSPAYQVAKLKILMGKVFSRFLKKEGIDLTPEQTQVLGLLMENETTSMNAISNELTVDNSAVTRLVDNLEQKGFVERRNSKTDRRVRVVKITKYGENEILKTIKISEQHQAILLKNLDKTTISLFMKTIKQMHENMINFSKEQEELNS